VRYGRRGGHPPRRHSRTVRDSFPSHGSSSHESLSLALHWEQLLAPGAWHMHSQSWRTFRVETFPAPMPSRMPAPRLHILGITQGIGFLGHPSRQGIRPGRLLPSLREPLTGYSVPRPFSVTLGRHCTPRPSYRVNTTYPHTTWPNGDVSLLGLRITAVSQVPTHDAYVPSSKILTIATCSRRHRFRLAVYPLSALALPRLIASLSQ
jgi:hypothetical protein